MAQFVDVGIAEDVSASVESKRIPRSLELLEGEFLHDIPGQRQEETSQIFYVHDRRGKVCGCLFVIPERGVCEGNHDAGKGEEDVGWSTMFPVIVYRGGERNLWDGLGLA